MHRMLDARLRALRVELAFESTGAQGLAAARQRPPDLILLDLGLPDMDGMEVLRLLKDEPATRDVPVVLLSDASTPRDKVRGFEAGAVDFVGKPFDPAELRARVRVALRTKALLDLLTSQAQIDGLTALHNRRYFDHRLREELLAAAREGTSVGLVLADIDRFKSINDEFGHPTGDSIIRRFAEILRTACRASDVACRYGGDEFAVILPGVDEATVRDVATRVLDLIRRDRLLRLLVATPLTASIGAAATAPGEAVPAGALLGRADEALYASKSAGRNRFTFAAPPSTAAA